MHYKKKAERIDANFLGRALSSGSRPLSRRPLEDAVKPRHVESIKLSLIFTEII
jgi:hypothetical protein